MACIRRRRGKYVVDWRDAGGRRRWVSVNSLTEANERLARAIKETQAGVITDTRITLAVYSERWMARLQPSVRSNTIRHHQWALDSHIIPSLGHYRLARLTRPVLRAFFAKKLTQIQPATVRGLIAVLHTLLAEAVEDQILAANPCTRIGKRLNLAQKRDEIKAFTKEQLDVFLNGSLDWLFPVWFTMARTGIRIGEACGLYLDDLDLTSQTIQIERTRYPDGQIYPTKTGLIRFVDVSSRLAGVLKAMLATRRQECFSRGIPLPEWLFVDEQGHGLRPNALQKQFRKQIRRLGLPPQFTPHSLRHTYASMLLANGESPVYVQRQLGHTSIKMTVDVYGKWLPMGNTGAVDKLEMG